MAAFRLIWSSLLQDMGPHAKLIKKKKLSRKLQTWLKQNST